MLPSRFCLKGIIFFFFHFSLVFLLLLFFCFLFLFLFCFLGSVRTAFKGYRLPTSCKKHTGTGSSSPKRAHCSGVVRSSFLPLQARFHYLSLYIYIYVCVCVYIFYNHYCSIRLKFGTKLYPCSNPRITR